MIARHDSNPISQHVSNRVYDGTRPVSPALLAALRTNHKRTHTTTVYRLVVTKVSRFFGWSTC